MYGGGGVFGLTEDAAHFNVLRKIHQSSLQNEVMHTDLFIPVEMKKSP